MTTEIPRSQWKEFFDNLSTELIDWQTSVEVISNGDGAQMLSEGLPFGGLTFVESPATVELTVGSSPDGHQSHTISDPIMVAFENAEAGPGGVLDIEDKAGTKTLINFLRPCPVLAEYLRGEMISMPS